MRRISILSAAVLLATMTVANAQSGGIAPGSEEMERVAMQDSALSQQDLRELAAEREPVVTGSIRAPTTSGSAQRTVTAPSRRAIIE